MKILCATDFSEPASKAASAAARIAKRLDAELQLAHVAHLPGVVPSLSGMPIKLADQEIDRRRYLLHWEAQRLRDLGCDVTEIVLDGLPDEELLAHAEKSGAELVVLGPRGERAAAAWSLGSIAARVIKGSKVPVLVVRDERSIKAWCDDGAALHVLVGVDASKATEIALAWTSKLARVGKLDVTAGHVYAPTELGRRHEFGGKHDAKLDAEYVQATLASDLGRRIGEAARDLKPRMRMLAGWGRVSQHLLDMASSAHAELLVIGTHRRVGFDRLRSGSVSLDIVAHATINVLTVPIESIASVPTPESHEIRRVLVPCDFSETSRRAVDWACTLLAQGGTLQLMHVAAPWTGQLMDFGGYVPLPPPTPTELAQQNAEIERKLRELVPGDAAERGIEAHVEAASAFDAADAIVQAAKRLEADAICLTTHGRSGLSRALLGSVAENVLRHATMPVFVVTPRER
jgi:nucleotide-binding universal stress UspA family protein